MINSKNYLPEWYWISCEPPLSPLGLLYRRKQEEPQEPKPISFFPTFSIFRTTSSRSSITLASNTIITQGTKRLFVWSIYGIVSYQVIS